MLKVTLSEIYDFKFMLALIILLLSWLLEECIQTDKLLWTQQTLNPSGNRGQNLGFGLGKLLYKAINYPREVKGLQPESKG